jgi:hypothetical protein
MYRCRTFKKREASSKSVRYSIVTARLGKKIANAFGENEEKPDESIGREKREVIARGGVHGGGVISGRLVETNRRS